MEDIIFLDGFPSQIICFGDVLPRCLGNVSVKPEKMILIVPGFPGIAEVYSSFARELHKLTKLPIWIIGYLGSALNVHCPNALTNKQAYGINSQINLICNVITRYLKGIKLVIWSHSMGSLLALKMLNNKECEKQILKVFMMFPILEVHEHTLAAKRVFALIKWIQAYPNVFIVLVPIVKKTGLVSFLVNHQTDHASKAISENNLLPLTFLGLDCKSYLRRIGVIEDVVKHVDKLKLYCCPTDETVTSTSYHNIIKNVSGIDAELDKEGLPHRFCLEDYERGAEIAYRWIKELKW